MRDLSQHTACLDTVNAPESTTAVISILLLYTSNKNNQVTSPLRGLSYHKVIFSTRVILCIILLFPLFCLWYTFSGHADN